QQSADHGCVGWLEGHPPRQQADTDGRGESMGSAYRLLKAERLRVRGGGLEPTSLGAAYPQKCKGARASVFDEGFQSDRAADSCRSTAATAQGDLLLAAARSSF